jgi:uncharacterized protein (DUF58 family)
MKPALHSSRQHDSLAGDRTLLAKKAQHLRLMAKSIAEGMRSGGFRSMYRGHGIEFSGVREYLRGDDVRTIDWNVTARMGKPFVKMFEEERELIVFLVIDRSLSMETGSGDKSRLQTACETGVLLTLAANQINSPVGAVFFDGRIGFSCAPENGRDHMMLLLSQFDALPESAVPGSVLSNALTGAAKLLKKRALVVIVSDFRSAAYEGPLASLALRHDVIAVRVTDPADFRLPDIGTIPFVDTETGYLECLPVSSWSFRQAWKEDGESRLERWNTLCIKRGVIPLQISTEDDPAACLTRLFGTRERP